MSDERCQGVVWERSGMVRGWGTNRACSKKAVKDGYCATHHPDAAKARRDASEAKWKAKRARESRKRSIEYKRNEVSKAALAYLEAREKFDGEVKEHAELLDVTKELRRLLNEDKES